MILMRLAWRNLWRNSKRSWITISAVATAFIFLIVISGLVAGLCTQLLVSGTELLLGHIQLHNVDYLPNRGLYDWMPVESGESPGLLQEIEAQPGIESVAPRVFGFALVSSGQQSQGAQLIGVSPDEEARVTRLLSKIVEGEGLPPAAAGEVLLGVTLGRSIGLGVGDELAVVTQAADGSLGNDLYRVRGLIDAGSSHLNRSLVILHYRDLQELLALPGGVVHEVVASTQDPMGASDVAAGLNEASFLPSDVRAESWKELAPQLSEYLQLSEGSGWFMIVLIGLFAAFGTLNTMAMAVFERGREIGHLSAMGMKPRQILESILAESVFLGILGLAIGGVLGVLLNLYLNVSGLNLSRWTGEFSLANSRFEPILKTEWPLDQFFWSAAGLMAAVVVATLIPAVRAARKDPVEALNEPVQG